MFTFEKFFELLTTTVKIRLKRLFQRFNTVSNSDLNPSRRDLLSK
jgi:hypothetical protein